MIEFIWSSVMPALGGFLSTFWQTKGYSLNKIAILISSLIFLTLVASDIYEQKLTVDAVLFFSAVSFACYAITLSLFLIAQRIENKFKKKT